MSRLDENGPGGWWSAPNAKNKRVNRQFTFAGEAAVDGTSIQESITGISHSGFYVEDLDRTAEFYTKVFGARVAWRNDKSKNPLMKRALAPSKSSSNLWAIRLAEPGGATYSTL